MTVRPDEHEAFNAPSRTLLPLVAVNPWYLEAAETLR